MLTPTSPTGQTREILSVTQLNRKARQLLETHFPLLWVEGEISNLTKHASGHWYFSLKDDKAQVNCAMFRNRNALVRFSPRHGQQVLLRARVSLYEPRGNYQLIAEHMEEAGHGALQRAYEELKARLQAEGLFELKHKQPLPSLPARIGVITSPSGAAIRDILTVLKRRFAAIEVAIFPVAVQGREAAGQIAAAIETANRHRACDLLLVARGGGSLEDLWAFNEEVVARAIFASRIPIVSGVGHEVDFTIADFVADARAPTPSAAAEMVSPDGTEWLQSFAGFEILLAQAMRRQINALQNRVDHLRARLRHPGERLQTYIQQLDNLEMRLVHTVNVQLQQRQTALQRLVSRQQRLHPEHLLGAYRQRLEHLYKRSCVLVKNRLALRREKLSGLVQLLESVSPLSVLSRGYAIVSDEGGRVLRRATETRPGATVSARLGQGKLVCNVQEIEP